MEKKSYAALGAAVFAAAAGVGATALAMKNHKEKRVTNAHIDPDYRNT